MNPRRLLILSVALSLIAVSGFAQFQTGNIFGRIVSQGQPLPGVTVTLNGPGTSQVFVSDNDGRFRFLSLGPGAYNVKAELAGMGSAVRDDVLVNIGRNSEIELTLNPSVTETITVTAETPLLDTRRTGTGATISEIELEGIPTARDPWVILQQVPGVQVDRINIGGNESGQQSTFIGKGTNQSDNTWNVDGVTITDMSATGSSPTYYDFGAFEEMQATTGGTDPRIQSPGVNLNLVTKRGTNDFSGSGRYLFTDRDFQDDPVVPDEAQSYLGSANEINRIEDYGVEVGGPIVRDRLWFWGSYGKQDISNLTAAAVGRTGSFDNTELENYNGKLNAQFGNSNTATGFFTRGEKSKFGRSVGPLRPPETGWIQGGPTEIWKFEDTHIFTPNLYLSGLYSNIEAPFFLTPVGGRDVDMYTDASGVYHRSYYHYETTRPQEQYRADGSAFFKTGSIDNELKFGFGYREATVESLLAFPGTKQWGYFTNATGGIAFLTRDGAPKVSTQYQDLYLGDTILLNRLTLQVGLRYDISSGSNLAGTAEANPVFPDLLPDASYAADPQDLEWKNFSPRLGFTYALGDVRRTLIRAAYNRYSQIVTAADLSLASAVPTFQALIYPWEDLNNDQIVQRNELDLNQLLGASGVDPDNPSGGSASNRIDYNSNAPSTDELIIGFEHELRPEFTVGINYTHRIIDNFTWYAPEKTQGGGDFYTSADYEVAGRLEGTAPGGQRYSVPYYRLRGNVDAPANYVFTNRPDYQRTYDGLEFLVTKQLANNWMLRGNFSLNDWSQDAGPGSFYDPSTQLGLFGTTQPYSGFLPNTGCIGEGCDGGTVAEQSLGSGGKSNIFLNSGWSYNVTGLYQLPWNVTLGASVIGREGYPVPYVHSVDSEDGTGIKQVLLEDLDTVRLDDVFNVDLRIAKEFRLADRFGVTISADIFNVTDQRTILQRDRRIAQRVNDLDEDGDLDDEPFAGADRISELQSPRVIRFGASLSF